MANSEPLLTGGLPIRRVGVVTQAVVTVRPDDDLRALGWQNKTTTTPITLPAQFYLGAGWQLTHRAPVSGQELKQNWLVPLFHDTRYLETIRLHLRNVRNKDLLDSLAAVFEHVQAVAPTPDELYHYTVVPPPERPAGFGGVPHLLYYKPLTGSPEQFLMLYDQRYAPNERGVVDASFVNVYEIVQVELDEDELVRLLREALEAAYSQ